jgi:hypothetical protein
MEALLADAQALTGFQNGNSSRDGIQHRLQAILGLA